MLRLIYGMVECVNKLKSFTSCGYKDVANTCLPYCKSIKHFVFVMQFSICYTNVIYVLNMNLK